MKKSVIISNIPAEYRIDLFNELAIAPNSDISFVFIPDKTVKHKDILWASKYNVFMHKSVISTNKSILYNYLFLFKYLANNKIDNILVGAIPNYFPVLAFYRFIFKAKIICWWAGNRNTEPKNLFKNYYRKICSNFIDTYFFYSKSSFEYFIGKVRKINVPSFIIGNNTRFSKIQLQKINLLNKNLRISDNIEIISIGFQEKRKNTILLLKAISILQNQNFTIGTSIIGDGPEIPILIKYVEHNHINNVKFIGNLSTELVYQQMLQSDILVHPSHSDSWPQVFNEASLCGLAIMISDKSGITNDYTERYNEEIIFNSENEDELALKIRNIIGNPDLLSKLKNAAFNNAVENDGVKFKNIFLSSLT